MADVSNLAAEARDTAGKGPARALRRSGRVPAVIYGDKKDPIAVSVDMHDLHQELHAGGFFRRLYDISVGGGKHRVLPRDIQRHPVTDVPLHVDFLRIRADARIAVDVAVIFFNEELSPGLKRGGVLNVVRHEIEMTCPADAIPEAIRIDLTDLEIGDSIHISAVPLPADCEPTISDRDFTIATVAAPTVIQEEIEEVAEGEEGEIEAIEGETPAEGETPDQAAEGAEKDKA